MCIQNLLLDYYQVKQKPEGENKDRTTDRGIGNLALYHWAIAHIDVLHLFVILRIDDNFWNVQKKEVYARKVSSLTGTTFSSVSFQKFFEKKFLVRF